MISSRQNTAARALINWTQGDLAEATGLHLNAINKIENEAGEPRTSTMERIQAVCEASGVRFRGQRGVEIREDMFEMLRFEGADYIRHLIDDFLSVMRGPQDEALICTPDERFFNESDPRQNDRYYKQMKKAGFRERCITNRDYHLFVNEDKSAYRWLPEKVLGTMTTSVYVDRVAFIHWRVREVLIVRNKSLAATFRGQFEFMWSQAKPFAA